MRNWEFSVVLFVLLAATTATKTITNMFLLGKQEEKNRRSERGGHSIAYHQPPAAVCAMCIRAC